MTFSKLLPSLVVCFGLLGCSTESQKKMERIPGKSTDFESDNNTNFRVKTYKAQSSVITGFNTYGIPTKKVYNFQACLQERMGKSAVTSDISFAIEDTNGKRIAEKVTDGEGCITWHETFEYNHIHPENLIRLQRRVKALTTYKGQVMMTTGFNPWVNGFYATNETRNTYIESVEPEHSSLSTGKIKIMNQQLAPIEIAIDSLNFEFKGLDYKNYEVSKLLNLTVAHKYTLRIKPTVIRRTLENIVVPQALVGGRFKAYLAIFRDNSENQFTAETFVTAEEFDLVYEKSIGQFLANVTIRFQNVSELSSRTKAVLTLVPSDELNGILEMSYQGIFKQGRLSNLSLEPGPVSARNFFQSQSNSLKTVSAMKPMTILESKNSGLIKLKPELFPTTISTMWNGRMNFKETLNHALYGKLSEPSMKYLTESLCGSLYPTPYKEVNAKRCQGNPGYFIKSEVRFLVDEVLSRPKKVGPTTTEELEMKVSFSESQKESYSRGWKANIGAGIGTNIPPFNFLGALSIKGSGGFDYNWTWEGKYAEDNTVSVSTSSSTKVTSEGNTFEFNVKGRPCLFVAPGAEFARDLKKNNQFIPGIFICGDQVLEQTRQETWYNLTQSHGLNDSAYSDNADGSAGPWRMMIRGRTPMLMFYNFMKDAKVNLVVSKLPENDIKTELDSSLMQMQEFPGLMPLK